MTAEYWIACGHCAKPVALTASPPHVLCFCTKECLEAARLTRRLTEDAKPAEGELFQENLQQRLNPYSKHIASALRAAQTPVMRDALVDILKGT